MPTALSRAELHTLVDTELPTNATDLPVADRIPAADARALLHAFIDSLYVSGDTISATPAALSAVLNAGNETGAHDLVFTDGAKLVLNRVLNSLTLLPASTMAASRTLRFPDKDGTLATVDDVGGDSRWLQPVDGFAAAPTGGEATGARYIVGTGTGTWAGHDGDEAEYDGTEWTLKPTYSGDVVRVKTDFTVVYYNEGGAWVARSNGAALVPEVPIGTCLFVNSDTGTASGERGNLNKQYDTFSAAYADALSGDTIVLLGSGAYGVASGVINKNISILTGSAYLIGDGSNLLSITSPATDVSIIGQCAANMTASCPGVYVLGKVFSAKAISGGSITVNGSVYGGANADAGTVIVYGEVLGVCFALNGGILEVHGPITTCYGTASGQLKLIGGSADSVQMAGGGTAFKLLAKNSVFGTPINPTNVIVQAGSAGNVGMLPGDDAEATIGDITSAINALIGGAPGALDTLNELAAAMADDAAFSATVVSALAAKAPLASPAFTGTPTGITKAHVGLGNVDNTSDASKPVSTAQASALALKAPIASPTLTGVPKAPTAAPGTNTTQLATTAFTAAAVTAAVNALIGGAPGALDTLNELAAAMADDAAFSATVVSALAGKAPLVSPVLTGTPTAPTATAGDSTTKLATTEFVTLGIVAATAGLDDNRGPYDASVDAYPSSGGSGTAGAILKSDYWVVSVAGTISGVDVPVGSVIKALTNAPGTTDANWFVDAVREVISTTDIEDSATTNDIDIVTGVKWWQGWVKALTESSFATAVRGVVLTGLSTASATAVEATDTILDAFGKLQAQINALVSAFTALKIDPISGFIETVADQEYVLIAYASNGATINHLAIKTASGTCTVAIKINGTSVTGLDAISVTSSGSLTSATALNVMVPGDRLTLVASANAVGKKMEFTMKKTR